MASAQFTADDKNIITTHPFNSSFLDKILTVITFAADDKDTLSTYSLVLKRFASLQPAQHIKLADSSKTLAERLGCLAEACFEQIKSPNESTNEFLTKLKPHFTSLVESKSDLDIWTAIAGLLMDFNSPTVPQTSTPTSAITPEGYDDTADQSLLVKLHHKWTGDYLPESLGALRDEIRSNKERIIDGLQIYAKTLLLVQSTGMGKSRLADKFSETCPMINFTLGEANFKCYPPVDGEVLSFFCKEMSEETKEMICASPRKKRISSKIIPERSQSKMSPWKTPTPQTPKSNRRVQLTEEDQEMTTEWPSSNKARESLPIPREDKSSQSSEENTEEFTDNLAITAWNHTRAAAFLWACFEVFNMWVEQQAEQQKSRITLERLAAIRHKSMAPYKHVSGERNEWSRRSAYRTGFCEQIISRADAISDDLLKRQEWRHAFHDDRDSRVRRALETNRALSSLKVEAKKLTDNLRKFQRDKDNGDDPLLVVVFDEASGLLKRDDSGNFDPGLYHALNRIISCLRELPIWFFFLSTESQLRMLLPANDIKRTGNYALDSSTRKPEKGNTPLEHFPPFLAFQLDVEDRRRMQEEEQDELAMCLDEFAAPKHMAKFGRPLWHAYDPPEMNDLAKLKLVGGKGGTDGRAPYDPTDVNHVFAALSFRLSLDPCLQNPRSLPLVRAAVNSFMRVIISMDHETGVMDTITPSEPVVAKAAMEFLCEKGSNKGSNWSDSIQTLTKELLEKALVEKGLKGELYARLVLTLARDCVWKFQVQLCQTQTFTVDQFLTKLYAEGHHKLLQSIPAELLGARMNFNHLVPTSGFLRPNVLPELLHDLLRRSAGMQLAGNQATYDIMIPIYFGDSKATPFDESECGVILIQVKNKDEATTPQSIFGKDFWEGPSDSKQKADSDISVPKKAKMTDSDISVLKKVKGPILFLLFDLGTKPGPRTPSVYVSRNSGENSGEIPIWAIHSRGNDNAIFGCLKHMDCETSSRTFFTSMKSKPSVSDTLCQRNKIFSTLDRKFRYPHNGSSPDSSSASGPASGPAWNPASGLDKRKRDDSNEEENSGSRFKPS